MALPQELVDAVIDNLAGDVPALNALSLVCSSFRTSSQAHIFRRITLRSQTSGMKNTSCALFHRLVSQSPHILLHVRTLVILDRTTLGIASPKSWIMDEPTLPPLLRMLVHLEGFHLHSRHNWREVRRGSPSLESAILALLASPKMKSIHFRGMAIPSSCVLQSPGLRKLLLNDLDFSDNVTAPTSSKIPIHYLGVSPWMLPLFASASSPFDTQHLLKLQACPQHDTAQYTALQTILNTASGSLLELEYLPFLTIGDEPPHHPLDLGHLSSLNFLVVWIGLGEYRAQPFAQLIWLCHVLDSLPGGSILGITIHLEDWLDVPIREFDWGIFDAALMRPELSSARATVFTKFDSLDVLPPTFNTTGRMLIDHGTLGFHELRYADL
ncbi:hypothetical protein B0H16DRAFT_1890516 [Mycena metata]|uniref:F-box domain-containing protein n=1 Tax=Mycena metata TaxID=1033252 RepID=A0AAD7IF70_9AGAR|nr:hypothetical protein B0H16DRAFT_1890516 [Mycena metata]